VVNNESGQQTVVNNDGVDPAATLQRRGEDKETHGNHALETIPKPAS
jgi:hypothetical protein